MIIGLTPFLYLYNSGKTALLQDGRFTIFFMQLGEFQTFRKVWIDGMTVLWYNNIVGRSMDGLFFFYFAPKIRRNSYE